MRAYPHGGGHTQNYDTGYGVPGVGQAGYSGTTAAPAYGSYGGGSSYGGGGDDTSGTTTVDPLNDGFSFYKGIPIYQTYYEKYLLQKAQARHCCAFFIKQPFFPEGMYLFLRFVVPFVENLPFRLKIEENNSICSITPVSVLSLKRAFCSSHFDNTNRHEEVLN